MRNTLPALMFILATSLAVAARPQSKASASDTEQEIISLNRLWADSIASGDMAALDRLFDDELIVITGDGSIRSKAEEMADLKPTADIKTYFFKTEDVRARVYKDAAVVTGHAKWRINFKGRDSELERRYTSVFIRRNGQWRIVSQQLSRVER